MWTDSNHCVCSIWSKEGYWYQRGCFVTKPFWSMEQLLRCCNLEVSTLAHICFTVAFIWVMHKKLLMLLVFLPWGYFVVMQSHNMQKNLKLAFCCWARKRNLPHLRQPQVEWATFRSGRNRNFPLQILNFSPQKPGVFWSIPNHNSSSDWKNSTERCSMSQCPNAALVYQPVYHESANTNCHPDPKQLSNYNFVIINYWVENHL